MLYLDNIAALTFWRSVSNPRQTMQEARPVGDIAGCTLSSDSFETQIGRLPSWLPRHLMVSDGRDRHCKSRIGYSVYSGPLPARSFYEIAPGICVASPELVFVQMCCELDLPLLLKLGCELCGTYAHDVDAQACDMPPRYNRDPATDLATLKRYVGQAGSLRGVKTARVALPLLLEGSASAKETELALALSLPRRYGGYGTPKPLMNQEIEFDHAAREVAQRSCARADLCWPEQKVDVEYDSIQWHADVCSMNSDKSRANALAHMGYRVIFVTHQQMKDQCLFDVLAKDIARALGMRLRGDRAPDYAKRTALREACRQAGSSAVFRVAGHTAAEPRYSNF